MRQEYHGNEVAFLGTGFRTTPASVCEVLSFSESEVRTLLTAPAGVDSGRRGHTPLDEQPAL